MILRALAFASFVLAVGLLVGIDHDWIFMLIPLGLALWVLAEIGDKQGWKF